MGCWVGHLKLGACILPTVLTERTNYGPFDGLNLTKMSFREIMSRIACLSFSSLAVDSNKALVSIVHADTDSMHSNLISFLLQTMLMQSVHDLVFLYSSVNFRISVSNCSDWRVFDLTHSR